MIAVAVEVLFEGVDVVVVVVACNVKTRNNILGDGMLNVDQASSHSNVCARTSLVSIITYVSAPDCTSILPVESHAHLHQCTEQMDTRPFIAESKLKADGITSLSGQVCNG
jgi:hypothetical protein